jgi:hypothetical protein
MPAPDKSNPGKADGRLQIEGPRVAVEIAAPTVLVEFLMRCGLPVPPVRHGYALIDTGASITAVDEEVVASLGIQPIGQMKLSTPSQSRSASLYAARLICSVAATPVREMLDIVGCTLQPQGFIALLGRNFLRSSVFVYDGPRGCFTLR